MDILLLILKIIGIVLLVLLAVILIVLLLVIFFPISYKLRVSYEDKVDVGAKVHWLFHAVSVTLDYREDVKTCILRFFGIPLTDFLNPNPPKEKKRKMNKKKAETVVSEEKAEEDVTLESFAAVVEEPYADVDETDAEEVADIFEETDETKTPLWEKMKRLPGRIGETVATILNKIKDIRQKGIRAKENVDKWVEILRRERTKVALNKVKAHVIKLLKHLLPNKWNAYVEMGFDDPATTGKILGYYWMFSPLWENHFICVPDFERKVLVAKADAKGRIQIFKFVYVVFCFLFDKDLVYLRKVITKAKA